MRTHHHRHPIVDEQALLTYLNQLLFVWHGGVTPRRVDQIAISGTQVTNSAYVYLKSIKLTSLSYAQRVSLACGVVVFHTYWNK